MAYKIDKNIPIPEPICGYRGKYPWREMKHGDSFFIPNIDKKKAQNIQSAGRTLFRKEERGLGVIMRMERSGARLWAYDKSKLTFK